MKALYFDGQRLSFREDLPTPTPTAGEALLRVRLAGLCDTDIQIVRGYMQFCGIPGHEFVAQVEEASETSLIGKRVVGEINCGCGTCLWCRQGLTRHCPQRTVLGIAGRWGTFAQFTTLPIQNLHCIPDSVSDEEAVFCEPLAAALEIGEQIPLPPQTTVLVLGDGKLGLLTAQVLALRGCHITLAGHHCERLALLEKRFPQVNGVLTDDLKATQYFSVVVEATGNESGIAHAMAHVQPRGTVVLKSTVARTRTIDMNKLVIDEITLIGSRCGPFAPALRLLASQALLISPLISEVTSLQNAIPIIEGAKGKKHLKILIDPALP